MVTVLRQLAPSGRLPALTIPILPRVRAVTNPPQTSLIFLPIVRILAVALTAPTVCLKLLIIGRTSSRSPLLLPRTSLVPLPTACPWQPLNLVERCKHPLPRLLTALRVALSLPLNLLLRATGMVPLVRLLRGRLLVPPRALLMPSLLLPIPPLPGLTLTLAPHLQH